MKMDKWKVNVSVISNPHSRSKKHQEIQWKNLKHMAVIYKKLVNDHLPKAANIDIHQNVIGLFGESNKLIEKLKM